ncbi:hypothetical protein [Teichococcus vastitatis]|uniref:hypothetical protein n=1 Tax=Teichococcus vastitatis TaxID=2307076 RepID=UPI000E70DA21|nr:hypothetical protein [Pseudoroseomonas vastitatis]
MCGLDPAVASKLVKICGLLGSDQEGERSAAAWQATRLLQKHGMSWQDVFAASPLPPPSPPQPSPAPQRASRPSWGHVSKVHWALGFRSRLTPWEGAFLQEIGRRPRISAKQIEVLDGIIRKLVSEAA